MLVRVYAFFIQNTIQAVSANRLFCGGFFCVYQCLFLRILNGKSAGCTGQSVLIGQSLRAALSQRRSCRTSVPVWISRRDSFSAQKIICPDDPGASWLYASAGDFDILHCCFDTERSVDVQGVGKLFVCVRFAAAQLYPDIYAVYAQTG